MTTRRQFLRGFGTVGGTAIIAKAASLASGGPPLPREKPPPVRPLRAHPTEPAAPATGAPVPSSAPSPTPTPIPPVPVSPPPGGWSVYPDDNVMILYADRKPVAQFQGSIEGRAPYGSKHTRGAYRPTTGRVYYGGGDHQCGGSGLPEDQGDSNANSAFYSMDPNDPTTIVMENHRYLTGGGPDRSEEHTSEPQSPVHLVCR